MTQQEVNTKFDKFLSDNNGKYIERVDSNALNQCFDLAIYWCEYLGFPKTIFSGLYGAHEIYDKWSNPSFEKIPNSPTFVPIKGDICVWSGSLNGGIGHVAVATGKGDTTYFESSDQNWVVGNPVTLVKHSYNYFLGVQRLKVTQSTMNDTKKAVQFDRILTFLKSQGYIASDNSSEYLENDRVVELVKGLWADRIVDRPKSSNWDRIVLKAGLPANATVDQVVAKLQTGSFDKNAFLEGVRKLLFG